MYDSVFEKPPGRGEKYPVDTDCYAPMGQDRNFLDQKLSEQSLELFQISGGGIDVISQIQDRGKAPDPLETQTPDKMSRIEGIAKSASFRVDVIKPAFSWSQICVTELAFRNVLATLHVFTPFLHVVHTFGTKTSDKQRARNVVHCHKWPAHGFEFCYNIRYFELNGRKRGNPWSLRQTGMYQNCVLRKQSRWILLNYSTYIYDRVSEAFASANVPHCGASTLVPHLFLLSAATRSWNLYIEALRHKVMLIEQKTYLSGLDQAPLHEHSPLFSDIQELKRLSDTISMAFDVINGQKEISVRCGDLHTSLALGHSDCDIADTIRMLQADLQHYHEEMTSLSRTTAKAEQLISSILAIRASNKLQTATDITQMNISDLHLQSRYMSVDAQNLLQVTERGHRDAIIMKILAQMAVVFLPASLVAASLISQYEDGELR
ncbi:hypothetical protein FOQG_17138 [Fusarium oxysporum f. sp. raphani 54005]|uniref:CorA-like transporter domain-containing protein n=1 Tax=Fusarium oxysporum f. sp. raphani 54005 TaxID=1089458 RepID=X0B7T0_FUSOX|nr:hypothetical protein FOQG_17138 [Fusarium oxysporum f. sp. raphani 54005]